MSDEVCTNRVSRGVPARLRMRTTARTPLASSNARRAAQESTRMQRSVSNTADASDGIGAVFCFGRHSVMFVVVVSCDGVTCRATRKRSTRIWHAV